MSDEACYMISYICRLRMHEICSEGISKVVVIVSIRCDREALPDRPAICMDHILMYIYIYMYMDHIPGCPRASGGTERVEQDEEVSHLLRI